MKEGEKREARRLRREEGWSLKRIAATLDVAVSSVSVWVRDIQLTLEQEETLRQANPRFNGQRNGAARRSERARCESRRDRA
jgi:hypothetical protein